MSNRSTKLTYLLLGVITCAAALVWLNFVQRDTEIDVPSVEENSKSTNQVNSTTQRYVSESYGVAFNYSPSDVTFNGTYNPPLEKDDRIYVGGSNGQWVQVFSKDPNQSIEDAIRVRFLSGIDSKVCYVQKASYQDQIKAPNVSAFTISYPINTEGEDPWWLYADKCGVYATTNGISYFYYNSLFPDRFYYFSIGQYAILSGLTDTLTDNVLTWQQTFTVLK